MNSIMCARAASEDVALRMAQLKFASGQVLAATRALMWMRPEVEQGQELISTGLEMAAEGVGPVLAHLCYDVPHSQLGETWWVPMSEWDFPPARHKSFSLLAEAAALGFEIPYLREDDGVSVAIYCEVGISSCSSALVRVLRQQGAVPERVFDI